MTAETMPIPSEMPPVTHETETQDQVPSEKPLPEGLSPREAAFDTLYDFIQTVSDTKSPEVGRYALKLLGRVCSEAANSTNGVIDKNSLEAIAEEIDHIPSLNKMQEKALDGLAKIGAIRILEDGTIVADLDRIKNLPAQSSRKTGALHWSRFYGNNNRINTMYFAFKDRKVISEEDCQQGLKEGKSLFYSPTSSEDAFDPEVIKGAEFYLGLWEITGRATTEQAYPSTEDQTNFAEVSLACKIYHPQYGNGYRDEATGKLFVFDQNMQEFRPVSGCNIFRGSFGLATTAQHRPAEYVAKSLPNLNRNGLLTPEDFKQIPSQGTERPYFVKQPVASGGSVMINNIQYYLGKQKEFQGAKVYKVSDTLAVMCLNGKITQTFPLRNFDDPTLKAQSNYKNNTLYKRTTKETTGLTAYDAEHFSQRKPEESEDDYQKRVDAVENLDIWLKLDSLLGDEGLGTYRQMEFEPEFAKTILSLQDKLDAKAITEIVNNYQNIIRSAREIGIFMRENLGLHGKDEKTAQNVVRNLMRKSLKLLLGYAENPPSQDQIQSEMSDMQSEVAIFAATFKESRTADNTVSLEDFQKFQPEAVHGSQIDQEMEDQMMQTLIQNRLDRPDIIDQARAEFKHALANPQSTFYLLKYSGALVGFFRMDRQGELDGYLGSLNVPPKIQGSGIGDETLKNYFKIALNERIGHASADPRNPITPLYIGRYNFVGTAVKPFGDTGRPFIEMRLDPQLNSNLRFFQTNDETITSLYRGNGYQPGQDYIILRFAEAELDTMMAESDNILSSGQYVMSAFRKIKNKEGSVDIYSVYEIKPNVQKTLQKAA